jgi:hypothetical protein
MRLEGAKESISHRARTRHVGGAKLVSVGAVSAGGRRHIAAAHAKTSTA